MFVGGLLNNIGDVFSKPPGKSRLAEIKGNTATTYQKDKIEISGINKSNHPKNVFQEQDKGFVKNTDGKFTIEGKPFRYIGANMYDLGREKPDVTEKMVQDAAKEGFSVIRFWAFSNTSKEKMEQICDLGKKYNIKFIPVLANNWGMKPGEKENDNWYRESYKKEYLPYVKEMVNTFKDRPEIMTWELVNEPETEKFDSIYNFTKDVSSTIHKIDNNHLVSIGTIGGAGDKMGSQFTRLSASNFKKLNEISTLDAVSIHDYSYDARALERLDINYRNKGEKETAAKFQKWDNITSQLSRKTDKFFLDNFNTLIYKPLTIRGIWNNLNQEDIKIAKDLKKPLYVGEVGFKKSHGEDRKKLIDLDMNRYFNQGAQGYMLWSF